MPTIESASPASIADPAALVIFGITGNLAQQMLIPALYHLESEGVLPQKFALVGIFRRDPDVPAIMAAARRQILRTQDTINEAAFEALGRRIHSIKMAMTEPEDFHRLAALLAQLDSAARTKLNHLFYLAIPPNIFETVIGNLSSAGLNKPASGERNSRILIEKPFGNDLASAEKLIDFMSAHFDEHQIFRIDHYLAKETAQNILTFRFNNPVIEGIWSRDIIDHIQITAFEKIGIERRVAFYENMGALRDFVQSHLMQLLALVMMDYPEGMTAESIHQQKLNLLESVKPIDPKRINEVAVRGQYEGYRDETGNTGTNVETYAALKLEVDTPQWRGVPILLRTGKSLSEKVTQIVVVFKDRTRSSAPDNLLVIRIQPNEGISLKLLAKKPGFTTNLQPVQMEFCYSGVFDGHQPDAYQRVLIDAMRGDQSLFATSKEVIASWRLLQPVLTAWSESAQQPEVYQPGSEGPTSAEELAKNFGGDWIENQIHVCPKHPRQPELGL